VDNPPAQTAEPPRRASAHIQFGILVVVGLRILDAITLAAIALGARPIALDPPPPLDDERLILVVGLAWAAGALVGALGLLLRLRWGWVLTMVMVGIGLAVNLVRVAAGVPDFLELLLLVVTAFYLNQRAVRAIAGQYRGVSDDTVEGEATA
jgi:hypothetical protein